MSDIVIQTTVQPIQAATANAVGVPPGGTVGQVITKTSDEDYAFSWEDPPGGAASVLSVAGKIGNVTLTGSDIGQDSTHRFATDAEKTTWNAKASTGDIPTQLSELSDDSTHRLVTDDEKATWNSLTAPTRTITLAVESTEIIATGEKLASVVVPVSGTINRWRMASDASTSAVVSIWKANGARPTVANDITGSAKPTLSSGSIATSTTLTGWTTSVAAGDVFVMSVDSNTAAKYLSVVLEMS